MIKMRANQMPVAARQMACVSSSKARLKYYAYYLFFQFVTNATSSIICSVVPTIDLLIWFMSFELIHSVAIDRYRSVPDGRFDAKRQNIWRHTKQCAAVFCPFFAILMHSHTTRKWSRRTYTDRLLRVFCSLLIYSARGKRYGNQLHVKWLGCE